VIQRLALDCLLLVTQRRNSEACRQHDEWQEGGEDEQYKRRAAADLLVSRRITELDAQSAASSTGISTGALCLLRANPLSPQVLSPMLRRLC